jgi:hypothetical protein
MVERTLREAGRKVIGAEIRNPNAFSQTLGLEVPI